ncbi:DUF305 domain-containing protein [Aurantimicrobium minutum]|uniref:DUF305 domain-containing protein n=1 Tax=Aurantimicrobium minutum TaxID=708131 RepID=A0A173LYJ3_9MICO|nr:DUF305 domain-containing protein [Aurantimicrobium minutum]BAV00057.1 Uncharacterized protein AUMI_115140 [Aurantimicrobium minutum]
MNKTSRAVVAGSSILVGALLLTGCTINIGGTGMNDSMMGNSESTSGFSSNDIMFAQMMIPHHQQAVDMSTLAETRSTNPEILALAVQIKDAQAPEIKQMAAWLESAGAGMDMGHDMGMGGMLTDEQMTALSNASGAEFDKLYLQGMIAHHEGAIQMAQMIVGSNNAEAKELAAAIISSQSAEIEKMKTLLAGM